MERVSVYIKPNDISKYTNGRLVFGFSNPCKVYNKLLNVSKEYIRQVFNTSKGTSFALKIARTRHKEAISEVHKKEHPGSNR